MICVGCQKEAQETLWGVWCDSCGGVMLGNPPKLFFRHVATADGAGGRFPIVYDASSCSYAVAYPRPKSDFVKCQYCGKETPADPVEEKRRDRSAKELGFVRAPFYVSHGTLDAIIGIVQPMAKGDSPEVPELSQAPSSTPEERILLGIE